MLVTYEWPFIAEINQIFKGHIHELKAKVACNYDPGQDAYRFMVHWHWLAQVKRSLAIQTFYGVQEQNELMPPPMQEYLHAGSVYFGCHLRLPDDGYLTRMNLADVFSLYADTVEAQFAGAKADIVRLITNKSVFGQSEEPTWQSSQSADSLAQAKAPSGTSSSANTDSSKSPSQSLLKTQQP